MAYAIHDSISVNISAGVPHSPKIFAGLKMGNKYERMILRIFFTAGKSPHWRLFYSHGRETLKRFRVSKVLAVRSIPPSNVYISLMLLIATINVSNYYTLLLSTAPWKESMGSWGLASSYR